VGDKEAQAHNKSICKSRAGLYNIGYVKAAAAVRGLTNKALSIAIGIRS